MYEVRCALFDALCKKYECEASHAMATLLVYMNNPVGIGEHPQHLDEMSKLVAQAKSAQDNVEFLMNNRCRLVDLGMPHPPFDETVMQP